MTTTGVRHLLIDDACKQMSANVTSCRLYNAKSQRVCSFRCSFSSDALVGKRFELNIIKLRLISTNQSVRQLDVREDQCVFVDSSNIVMESLEDLSIHIGKNIYETGRSSVVVDVPYMPEKQYKDKHIGFLHFTRLALVEGVNEKALIDGHTSIIAEATLTFL